MDMKKISYYFLILISAVAVASCAGAKSNAMATGGEVTGVRGTAMGEATPFGMVAVQKGSLRIGLQENDTLWGAGFPSREISVDGFWMDQTEVSNAPAHQPRYRQGRQPHHSATELEQGYSLAKGYRRRAASHRKRLCHSPHRWH